MSSKINSELFSARAHALDNEMCPQCQRGHLHLRHGKHGPFLACDQYPSCDYLRSLHNNDGHVVKALGVACPECDNELVLRQGRFGMFIGCSGYPQCHYLTPIQQHDDNAEKPDNPLCPECLTNHIVERKTRFGKTFYACDGYPKCKFAVNLPPLSGRCQVCGFALLVEKKTAQGVKRQCASRKCQQSQSE